MKVIDAAALDYKTLNEVLRQPEHDYVIEGCCGQRFIGAGMSDRNITVNGISGNALGAYLNNASITERKCAGRRRRYDERRKDFDSWQRRRCGRIRYERR